jgi:hypothetical protein
VATNRYVTFDASASAWRPAIEVAIPPHGEISDMVLFRKGEPFTGPDGKPRYPVVQFRARVEFPRVRVTIAAPAPSSLPAEDMIRWSKVRAFCDQLQTQAFFILSESIAGPASNLPPDALFVPELSDSRHAQAVAMLTALDTGLAGKIRKDAANGTTRTHRTDHRPSRMRFCLSHHNDFSVWADRCAEALLMMGVPYRHHARRYRADWTADQYHAIAAKERVSLFRDMCDELRRAALGEFR